MAYDVTFTEPAEWDKDQIVSYLLVTLGNRGAAARFLMALDNVVGNLSRTPQMYPCSTEGRALQEGYRKANFLSYVLPYRFDGHSVEIARIFHARQDYARLL